MRPILSIGLIALLLCTAGCTNPVTKVIDKLTNDEPAASLRPRRRRHRGSPPRRHSRPPCPLHSSSPCNPQRLRPSPTRSCSG